ncbi:hypothetical protein DM01DRAFT_1216249 [Hesseltinella vesiculosa]|uniref:Secreted protein n=1 Tax=Hesseltinella vesiculosa TaxID=101127 RepID=A0A1X2GNF9_9FUNG|nr:hypothetical protein DM01DRAFT_1216249 [Hesseltinella vesiculosa]
MSSILVLWAWHRWLEAFPWCRQSSLESSGRIQRWQRGTSGLVCSKRRRSCPAARPCRFYCRTMAAVGTLKYPVVKKLVGP